MAMARDTNGMVVLETDFGLKDGAVAAMKGVALGVDRGLILHDLSHDIPPFDIWAGAYQLDITMPYWPKGTVFVAVIDPGVGTERGAVVARTGTGQYVVGPDNGLLTLVAEHYGIEAVRRIDEAKHRLPGSEKSYTFHGRDVFSYTAAKLAGGVITFEEVGPVLPGDVHRLAYTKAAFTDGTASGMVPSLDVNFGNVWTNIDRETFAGLGLEAGRQGGGADRRGEGVVRGDSAIRQHLRRRARRGAAALLQQRGQGGAGDQLRQLRGKPWHRGRARLAGRAEEALTPWPAR